MKFLQSFAILLAVVGLVQGAEPVAEIRKGEVWVNDGKRTIKLTETGGKIDAVNISLNGRYAAANKIIGQIDGHDDSLPEGQKAEPEPIYSILILDLIKHKMLVELRAPQSLTKPMEWQGNGKYRFGEGGPLDVYAYHEYDPLTNKVRELKFNNETGGIE